MKTILIKPVERAFCKTVRLPGSKSITNRALPMAALAEGTSTLTGVLFADDTRQMIGALEELGYGLSVDEAGGSVTLTGCGTRVPRKGGELVCGNSGTTIRFLTAMLATADCGDFVLDGVARMRERPIGQLVDQLRGLGATIEYAGREGYPPVRIRASGLAGGACQFAGVQSSQYISAILLAAPYAHNPVTVQLVGPITSEPYVTMTLRMMEQFGVRAELHDQCVAAGSGPSRVLMVAGNGHYVGREYAIEPDASNASYFLAAAALFEGASVTVAGLGKNSLQGDIGFANVLGQMGAEVVFGADSTTVQGTGVLHGVDVDMNRIPDMVQTLAVVALFADSPTRVRNVGNLRIKETDRLAALETELRKLGGRVETTADSITITPPGKGEEGGLKGATVGTYDDHRMAMAFAVAGLRIRGVVIENPECVAKTYPGFFGDLEQVYG